MGRLQIRPRENNGQQPGAPTKPPHPTLSHQGRGDPEGSTTNHTLPISGEPTARGPTKPPHPTLSHQGRGDPEGSTTNHTLPISGEPTARSLNQTPSPT